MMQTQYGNMTKPDRSIDEFDPGSKSSNGTKDSNGNEVGLEICGIGTDEMKTTAAIIALISVDDSIGNNNYDNCIGNINSISDKNSDHYIRIKSENNNRSISINITGTKQTSKVQ